MPFSCSWNSVLLIRARQTLAFGAVALGLYCWLVPLSANAEEPNSAGKTRIVARYSDGGIVSSEGQEKVKVYQYQQPNGVTVFTDKAPSNNAYQILLYECFACRPDSKIDWNNIRLFRSHYDSLISRAARKHQLEPALIRAVIHAESAFDFRAISRSGAMGLMQLMPETAKEMGVSNAFVPEENILGGSKYLAQMLKLFNGDIALACAAYNAGPTTVTQYNGIPPYPETKAYVERVQILLKRYRQQQGA
ncbi:MAG: lytic transglycosylase domain-containing protein [Shewanella sp.]|uniref:lytic transglycosylase domain-containing protein n=1 Tax=Shewanella sp. TaxID=50422 RepID=UPI003F3D4D47